jgi:MFS family permease
MPATTASAPRPSEEQPQGRWSAPLGESWRAWIALGVGVLAVSAHSALHFGTSPLLKPITDELGWSRSEYAMAMNLRLVLMMCVVPFAGRLVDRLGARAVLSLGALLMGLGALAMSRVEGLAGLYATSLLTGPGQACVGSVAGSALVLRQFRRHRGVAVGALNGGDNLITSLVHVSAASLLVSVGWRGTITALAAGYFLLSALFLAVLRPGEGRGSADRHAPSLGGSPGSEPARDSGGGIGADENAATASLGAKPHAGSGVRELLLRDRRLWLLLASFVVIYAFVTSVGIHFPAFQRDLGRSPELAARIYGLSTLIGAFGSVLCGWLSERTSARTALCLVVAGLALTSIALWLPLSTELYFGWAVAYGIFNAGVVALLALVLAELFGADHIGSLMGVAMVFCMGATVLANTFTAGVFDATGSYQAVWRVYTVLLALTLVPVVTLRRMRP